MPVDDRRYVDEVLEPARTSGTMPGLLERYQISVSMPPAQLAARVEEVRKAWRRARQKARFTTLIDQMQARHAELAPVFDAVRNGDLGPLKAEIAAEQRQSRQRADEFTRELVAIAGPVRRIAPHVVTEVAARHHIAEREVAALSRSGVEGIAICAPDALPDLPPIKAFDAYRTAMGVLDHRHAPDFVFERRLSGISIFDRFAVAGEPRLRLDRAVLDQVRDRWAERPRGDRSRNADTIRAALRAALDAGVLLRLVQYEVAAQLRERQRTGLPPEMLLRHATDVLGIATDDARRLVFAIRHEQFAAGPSPLRKTLEALRDSGRPYQASREVEAATSIPEDARELAERISAAVAQATRLREQANRVAATGAAETDRRWSLLAEARRLVPDLPSLDEALRRLAPAPATNVRVTVSGTGVSVSWRASESTVGEIVYRVVCQHRRPPADPQDVNRTVAETGQLAVRDESPEINETLYYAVQARRDEASAPLAVGGPVVVRPEPDQVELSPGEGVVEGRWQGCAKAERILVRRGDSGTPARSGVDIKADRHGFRDRDVRNGTTYHYWIAAVYLDRAGHEVITEGAVYPATPNRPADPVRSLRLRPDPADIERLFLEFALPRHGTPRILELPNRPQWPIGRTVAVAEALAGGSVVGGTPTPTGLIVRRPRRPVYYLAVTVAGERATIGAVAEYQWIPPLAELTANRLGTDVVLAWRWPPELSEVDVQWAAGRVRVTPASYQANGGVRVPAERTGPSTITVRPVIRLDDADRVGAPQTVTAPGRPRASYDIATAGPPWRRTLVVRVHAEAPVRIGRLALGLRGGRVIPLALDQCERLGELLDVEVSPDRPARLEVPVPRARRPYWLRCFVDDDAVELLDPPRDRLRRD